MNDEERIVLVFDIGTQSTRTLLINAEGRILGAGKKAHAPAYFSPQVDWAEQDADYYYRCMCETASDVKFRHGDLWEKIEAVSITTIRDTIVCADENGKPLRPAILWLDKRQADGKPALSHFSKLAFRAAGMTQTVNMQFQKSHCNWIRQNEPDVWAKTKKCLLLSSYLTFKLTGKMADASPSIVSHLPFDSKKRNWMSPKALTWPIFPVEPEKLSEVRETGEILGYLTEKASKETGLEKGLPVIATGSDKACEILGLGCTSKENAAIGLGTTATITFMIDRYLEPERFIPPYHSVIPGKYTPEVEIFRGYWLISWFKKEFASKEVEEAEKLGIAAEKLLDARVKEIPPGCDGLLFQPYFTPNVTMPTARGAAIGFSDVHTRIHIYRAIIEGINFALMDGMKLMEKRAGHKFEKIYLGGGGSQSEEICQITADMFGLPVIRTESHEATGIGCALTMFVSLGVFGSYEEGVKKMIREKDRFLPDRETHKVYDELYESVFKRTYGRLRPLYKKLHEIYRAR